MATLIAVFIVFLFPVLLILLILYGQKHGFTNLGRIFLITIMTGAVLSGLISLFYLPTKLLNIDSENIASGIRMVSGVLLLIIGLILPSNLQKYFLMVMGLLMIAIQLPFIFTNFGSLGAFVLVGLAFVALVIVTIWLTKRSNQVE